VAFALAGADIVAAMALRSWLNAESDGRFWGALAVLGAITFAAASAAVGHKARVL
jgi:hypothetical protein